MNGQKLSERRFLGFENVTLIWRDFVILGLQIQRIWGRSDLEVRDLADESAQCVHLFGDLSLFNIRLIFLVYKSHAGEVGLVIDYENAAALEIGIVLVKKTNNP